MLRQPTYAGIYAYGRSTLDPRRRQPGRPCTGRVRVGRGGWLVYLPGVLPAYISIEQYERNSQRLDAIRSRALSLGAVRDGPALLAGLVACGRCGKKMTVRYQRGPGGKLHPAYVCDRDKSDYAADQCQQLAGPGVDAYVTGLLLQAVAPAALEVSLAAAGQAEQQRAQVDRIWRQRLERADYQADRARRQYQLAEPENRLVVRQLERDWEAALAERQRLGEEYDRFAAARPRTLTAAEREQIRALAADLPAVWDAPTTTDADRKQLIRHLALPQPRPPQPPGPGRARMVAARPGRPPGHARDHPRCLGPARLGQRLPAPPGPAARGPRRSCRGRAAPCPAPGAARAAQPPP